jgi:polyisoprenoid-binding protein YceI
MKRFAMFTALVAHVAIAQAAPETFVIDASQTASEFSYRYLGISNQTHRFDRISGKVVLDLAAKTGSADVVIDATSVNTGHSLLNEKIQDKDFFDSARYPAITFKSGRMTLDGEQPSLAGDLTIKGVTRPVTLAITQFKCESDPVFRMDTCGAQASVTIKRSDFNMGKLAFLVSNDITLNLAIKAVREAPLLRLASRDPIR